MAPDETPDTDAEAVDAPTPDAEVTEQPQAAPEATEPEAPAEQPAAESKPDATPTEETAPTQAAPQEQPAAQESPGRPAAKRSDGAQDDNPAAVPVPGADLEVDIVPEGVDPLAAERSYAYGGEDEVEEPVVAEVIEEIVVVEPIEEVAIDLAAGARYSATGKRKTAIARVTLRPGSGSYTINGRPLDAYFPRETLQRNIRQPLETVGYEERMDVIARMQGGGVSSQAGALRHGISRALLEADPNLRGELKRRGFLTRDARAKERKKAGLKKARKRPQFSKR
jgi:small subunit ribosomal protein S9